MNDELDDEDDGPGLTSVSDLVDIGQHIVDMCNRLKPIATMVPGAQAKWGFEIDGELYRVVITMPGDAGK